VFLAVVMAESLRYKFEEHLTCSVCLEPFKDPKVLPCLHSYCHACIVKLAENAKSSTINCPECRLAVEVRIIDSLPIKLHCSPMQPTCLSTQMKLFVCVKGECWWSMAGSICKNLRKLKFLKLVLRGCLYQYRFLGSEKIIFFLGAQSEDSLTS
jgi:hypothetical protein